MGKKKIQKKPNQAQKNESLENSSVLIVHNREDSEISRDLFRADMIPTEGDE